MKNFSQTRDALYSLVYLINKIAIQQWKLLLSSLLILILFFPLPILFFSFNENYRMSTGFITSFAMLPSLIVLLIFLPIVYSQINSSSIKKRVSSVGISSWIFTLSISLYFTLIAIVVFYVMIIFTTLIYSGHEFYNHGEYVVGNDPVKYILFRINVQWLTLLLIVPISFYGLSTLGILISLWKVPDNLKGFMTFIILLLLLATSRLILSPLDWTEEQDMVEVVTDRGIAIYNWLRFLNPWGSMVWTIGYSISGDMAATYFDGMEQLITSNGVGYAGEIFFHLKVVPDLIYSILMSFILNFLILFLQK